VLVRDTDVRQEPVGFPAACGGALSSFDQHPLAVEYSGVAEPPNPMK